MSCLPQTWPTVFLRINSIKPTNAVQMLYSISSSKLHHTSGQWCVVTSNFLLFNIIIMYCLSHNLLCSFTINSLQNKTHHKHPPSTYICHASVGTASQTSYICYNKQLGRSRSPKMRCIHLVLLHWLFTSALTTCILLRRRGENCSFPTVRCRRPQIVVTRGPRLHGARNAHGLHVSNPVT